MHYIKLSSNPLDSYLNQEKKHIVSPGEEKQKKWPL